MKCPKCAYLGYAPTDRCRNCGYEFSLNQPDAADLRLHDRGQVPQPLTDLDLLDSASPAPETNRFTDVLVDDRRPRADENGLAELPLFGAPITDDVPLITKASPPRPPLAVRRATPEVPRLRSEPRAPLLDWADPHLASMPPASAPGRAAAPGGAAVPEPPPRRHPAADAAAGPEPAGFPARAVATAIDLVLLVLVDIVVVYFTLKICRLTIGELSLLPKAPLVTFLLLQNVGYLVAFTATGQTLGKMIAGVRVLAADDDCAPDVGRAALRAAVWMILALPAGLGLLSAIASRDGRGIHDRFAGTRVVRAGA